MKEFNEDIKYRLALSFIKGIGPKHSAKLIEIYGSALNIFRENSSVLNKIPYIGETLATGVKDKKILERAEKEINFCQKYNIEIISVSDSDYPIKLKECTDAPQFIFCKGENTEFKKAVSIVGTRNATSYGKEITENLIKDISENFPETIIISGLAYGVDICSHKSALKYGLSTVAVLAHGMDKIYPAEHKNIAAEIVRHGELISEYPSETDIERGNFIARNRIVAGLSDATIVIESKVRGGAMITARLASSYNREVMAFPGKTTDQNSRGCNELIKMNIASLIQSGEDLYKILGWDCKSVFKQMSLNFDLTPEEKVIYDILKPGEPKHINELSVISNIQLPVLSGIMIDLEMKNIIKSEHGSIFKVL